MRMKIQKALISSWRKSEAIQLAKVIDEAGEEIYSSGGTAKAINEAGIEVKDISVITGFNELLKGRVKTLHPHIHAAILARKDDDEDMNELRQSDINPFDLLAVDLYPFDRNRNEESAIEESIELIDIGGVALIRAAAKNFPHVTVLSRAEQFTEFADYFEQNEFEIDLEYRRKLAGQAFKWTSRYDELIASSFGSTLEDEEIPEEFNLSLQRQSVLRYGENPHQPAAFFVNTTADPYGISNVEQLGGKKLSFNNILDLDIALRLPHEFDKPAAAILKHTTPCGVGQGENLVEALDNAHSTDPVSAFGSIIGFNRTVDLETAKAVRKKGFVEVVTSHEFSSEAVSEFKKSKNLRIIKSHDLPKRGEYDLKSVLGGYLYQSRDFGFPELEDIEVVSRRKPDIKQMEALTFAWIVVKYVKSNAIVIADPHKTIGIGAGQMSRVDSANIAVKKAADAGLSVKGSVVASDAFFPFRDGVDSLIDAGVEAFIQPGGSIRDKEVIEAVDERDAIMIFTGRRHFRH